MRIRLRGSIQRKLFWCNCAPGSMPCFKEWIWNVSIAAIFIAGMTAAMIALGMVAHGQEKPAAKPSRTELTEPEALEYSRLQAKLLFLQRVYAEKSVAFERAKAERDAAGIAIQPVAEEMNRKIAELRVKHNAGPGCEPSIEAQKWVCREVGK